MCRSAGETLLQSAVTAAALLHMAQHMLKMCVQDGRYSSHGNARGIRGHVETYKAS